MNKAIVIGRLGKDPESKAIQGGALCTFSVATSESYKGRDGEKQERTEWHRISVFGKLADICAKYLAKGALVLVEGRLQTRSWDDEHGNKRFQTDIIASNVQFLDSKKKSDDEIPF